MNLEERLIVERTSLELDPRPRNTPQAVWETLQQFNIKAMMDAQGADMARVTRKMVRSLRWVAYDQLCPMVKPPGQPTLEIRVMSTMFMGAQDSLQVIWAAVVLLIEQRLHRKHLPMRKGWSKTPCRDQECRIGCQAKRSTWLMTTR